MDKDGLKELTSEFYRKLDHLDAAAALDRIKTLGFHYASTSGITIGMNDIQVSLRKQDVITEANHSVEEYEEQYMLGLMTDDERYTRTVDAWTKASDRMEEIVREDLSNYGGIAVMAVSGAKGNIAQIKQMAGMRGLMSNPKGRIIDMPIKSSFREGLTALEYFISTHGARKGLADTALRTADSGYLTRRLIDVSQDVIILEEDCGTTEGVAITRRAEDPLLAPLEERLLGRTVALPIVHPETGEVLGDSGEEISEEMVARIKEADISQVTVRSAPYVWTHDVACVNCATGESPRPGGEFSAERPWVSSQPRASANLARSSP